MAQLVSQVIKTTVRTFAVGQCTKIVTATGAPKYLFFRSISTTQAVRAAERWYTDKHEWVEIKGNIGIVGISDYAQDALGDVVFAQLPDVGSTINKDEECGALESVKAASEIISPVTGKVVESNEAVVSKPGLVNTSCYNEGWLFKVELKNPEEIKSLMNEESYTEYLKSDPH